MVKDLKTWADTVIKLGENEDEIARIIKESGVDEEWGWKMWFEAEGDMGKFKRLISTWEEK